LVVRQANPVGPRDNQVAAREGAWQVSFHQRKSRPSFADLGASSTCILAAIVRRRQHKAEAKNRGSSAKAKPELSGKWDRHAVFAMMVAVLVAYLPALDAGFTNWDDDRFFTENPLFQGPVGAYVTAALTRIQFQAYHPLHLLSYLPDRLLWPDKAAGFHALNMALFALALTLGYFLLRRSVGVLPALGAMLLVGLHPLAVESVAWAVGRKDVLALLLVFATLLAEDREPRTRGRVAVACALAALACLAKTSAVVVPIVLFAWLHFARAVPIRLALRRTLPFVAIALVFALPVPFIWRHNQMIPGGRPLPLLLDVLGTLGVYAGRVLAPVSLSPVYPALASGQVIAALVMVAGLLVVVGTWRRLPAGARFAAVAFVGCLLPVANITQVYFRFADRYALLALGALAWPVATLLAWPKARKVVVIAAPLLIAVELWATMQLAPVWHDSLALWQHATAAQPRAIYGHLKLGETLRGQKRFREAAACYVRAGDIEPGSIKGPAGLLRTLGEKAEADGRIPAGTYAQWEQVIAAPGFDARKMEMLIAILDKSDCRSCAEAMLWLGLRMFPQSDTSLVSFARKEIDRGKTGTAMVYLSEIRDANTPGLAEVAQRLRAPGDAP
jgi:protein O-mannosyl-transferase